MARRRHQAPRLRRSKTKDEKNDRWWFRAYVDVRVGPGKTERTEKSYHIGYCKDMGIREAQRKMAEMVRGLNQTTEIIQSQVRFGEVIDKWLDMADVKPQTYISYNAVVRAQIRPKWGEVRMCDITTLTVEEWIRSKAREMTETTTTRIRRVFSQIWKCALRWEYTDKANPMSLVPKLRNHGNPARDNKLPSIEQFHRFLSELDTCRELVIFAVGTGMRISEILALRWRQMDGEFLTIEQSRDQYGNLGAVKTKRSNRTIPIKHISLARPEDAIGEDFVFGMNYQAIHHEIKRAATKTGIYYQGFSTHTFRRMHNTLFRRASDGRIELAQKQLGHADQKTNDIYYVADETDLKARQEIVERMMGKVMGGVQ